MVRSTPRSLRRREAATVTQSFIGMKTRQSIKNRVIILFCVLALTSVSTPRSFASDNPAAIVVDTVLVRPVCLASTIIGGAFFFISLPLAVTSKSIRDTTRALVVKPAAATFTRPLGDFEDMSAD